MSYWRARSCSDEHRRAQVHCGVRPTSRRPLTSSPPTLRGHEARRTIAIPVSTSSTLTSFYPGAVARRRWRTLGSRPVQPRPTSHHRYSCCLLLLLLLCMHSVSGGQPVSVSTPLRPHARRQGTTFAPPPAFCDCDLAAGQISFAPCPWIARQRTVLLLGMEIGVGVAVDPGDDRHDPVRPPQQPRSVGGAS